MLLFQSRFRARARPLGEKHTAISRSSNTGPRQGDGLSISKLTRTQGPNGAHLNGRMSNTRLTFETMMMGTMDAWNVHSSWIGASGLRRSATPAEKQTRNDRAATALPPLLPPLPDRQCFKLTRKNGERTKRDLEYLSPERCRKEAPRRPRRRSARRGRSPRPTHCKQEAQVGKHESGREKKSSDILCIERVTTTVHYQLVIARHLPRRQVERRARSGGFVGSVTPGGARVTLYVYIKRGGKFQSRVINLA